MTELRVQSVERAIDILLALSSAPKTLTEVARETGLPKGTAFRLLSSLGHQNLVLKEKEGNLYMLGPGFLRMIQGLPAGISAIAGVAKPALTRLWQETSETIALHVRIGFERVCVEELPSPLPIRYMSDVGLAVPLWVGSAGKVLLAFTDDADRERVLASVGQAQQLDGTPFDADALRKELAVVQRRGWATSAGERIAGAAAVSVPIRQQPSFLASLSVLGPTSRLSRRRRVELVPLLKVAATEIETNLAASGLRDTPALRVASR